MQAASRPYVLAAAALAATSAVVALPLAPRPARLPVLSMQTRLVDAESIANVPMNLFDDILNIPYNEINALDAVGASEFFTGSWFVPSSANIWGIDPGDPTHVALTTDIFLPFTGLNNGVGGLQYELDGLLAAEIPTTASCDAETCAPMTPSDVITHSTGIDRNIGFLEAITGQAPNGASQMFEPWFATPLSDLTGGKYTFDSTTDPGGIVNPSGVVYNDPAFTDYLGGQWNPFIGGTGVGNTMPWDGTQYTLNLFQPFENFWVSLQAPVTGGFDGTGIVIPDFTGIVQSVQSAVAGGIVAFDPFVPGSSVCPALCDVPSSLTVPSLVEDVQSWGSILGTGNDPMITAWQTDLAAGTANGPTNQQVLDSIALLQTGMYNLTPTELASVDTQLNDIAPGLAQLFTNDGIITDPSYLDPNTLTVTDGVLGTYGGYDPQLVFNDLVSMGEAYQSDPSAFANLFNGQDWLQVLLTISTGDIPAASSGAATDSSTAAATDLSSSLATLDPTLSTDLSTLLASFGTTAGSDLLGQLTADLGTQLATDLGTVLPSSLLSLF